MIKLRNAIREYENDRWRIISSKVGNGFSPAACKDKAVELDDVDPRSQEQEPEQEHEHEHEHEHGQEHEHEYSHAQSSYASSSHLIGGPSNPGASYR